MSLRIHQDQQLLESRLAAWLDRPSPLYQAARHIVLAPAKRLRSLLILSAAQDLGAPIAEALDPACALEFLHSYSLIHDDLPAMDNDAYRRGVPTLHTLYGDAIAVLVGDFLHTLTFQVLSECQLPPATKIELIQVISRAAGGEGMIQGQYLDLTTAYPSPKINALKTGCLFEAALHFSGILAQTAHVAELAQIGLQIGILFQHLDDLEDRTSPEVEEQSIETACALHADLQARIDTIFSPDSRTRELLTWLSNSLARFTRDGVHHVTP